MPSAQHTVTEEMSAERIARRLELLRQGLNPDEFDDDDDQAEPAAEAAATPAPETRLFYRPWEQAADEYIAWSKTPEKRIYTGIPQFDEAMRGLAPGELMLVVGYAHSGKTVFTTQVLLHNHDKRVAVFTPDETRVLVLVKMASILHGVSAEEIEERLAAGDSFMEELLRDVARDHFPHFAVFDEITDLALMDQALDECVEVWGGEQPQLVVIDYAGLVTGAGEDIPSIMNSIKAWGKRREVPLIVLHQASRTAGAAGKKLGMDSGSYGGEQQATFLIGVRRKREQYQALIDEAEEKLAQASQESTIRRLESIIADAAYERERHTHTVTFSLVKNKRPPSRLVDDTDFILDPDTGRVAPFDGAAASKATYQQTVEYQQGEAF